MQRRNSSAVIVAEKQSILEKIESVTTRDKDLSLYVIVLNGLIQNITIKWLLQLLEKSSHESGGQFLLSRVSNDSESDITLHVSASNRRLNISADAIDLKQLKPNESVCRLFRVDDLNIDSDQSLTVSEKQKVLLYQIESLRTIERGVLFGYPNVKLYPGQSISEILSPMKMKKY